VFAADMPEVDRLWATIDAWWDAMPGRCSSSPALPTPAPKPPTPGSNRSSALPALWTDVGVAYAILVIAGGLLYIAGAIAYHHRRRPDPFPSVFGYHEVFHAFVCAAATCHYVAIVLLVA
jgi:hypothetical protein